MRLKSHRTMGQLLLQEFMPELSALRARAFLIGCIEPDRNPTTYLKGSLRSQWMRGHNYTNSDRFMARLAKRLEKREHFRLWDYYSMGKLIHYTLDAFTFPHNAHFKDNLAAHRQYEVTLQTAFLCWLPFLENASGSCPGSAAELIGQLHAEYMQQPGCAETDIQYAFNVSCLLVQKLMDCRSRAIPAAV